MKTTVSSTDDQKKAPNDGNKPERIWPQILAIFTACMVPLTAGMLFTWSSPFIPKISSDKTNYDISEEEASYFTVIPPIAMIITSLLFSNLNDIFGRKPTMIINAIPYVIAWILAAVASNIWVFYASRVFSGIGDGFVFSSVPMYIAEISTPKVRGVWGNALTFFIYIGQLLIAIIGSYCSVKVSSYIGMCVPILFIVIFLFMPESPYFYVMKGKFEEARSSLRRLRGIEDVEEDFLQIKADVERQMSEKGTWKDLFVIDSNRRALYAGVFLRTSQQLGGIGCFATYSQFIFAKSGGNLNPELSMIIFFATVCVFNVVGAYTLDILGRRRAYIVSVLFCGIILLVEALYFYAEQYDIGIDVTALKWIPLTGMIIYVVFYSVGIGIVPTLMLGELFSASIKPKGLTVLCIVFGVVISVITKLFHLMTTNFGLYSPFLLFSVGCFVSTIVAFYLVIETKGKTLEEIQQHLKGPRGKNRTDKISSLEL